MATRFSHVIAGAIVVALIASISISARASTPPGASLGLASIGGSPVSGGSVSYNVGLNVTSNGTLVVKATLKGKKLSLIFPVLTVTNPALGAGTIAGTVVNIPASFTGPAMLRLQATYNRKSIGSRAVPVTVTATPPPNLATVTTSLYDVGYENSVTLNGAVVPTAGMGAARTYAWTQTGGMRAALSASNVVAPSFTTAALTNFVNMGTSLYVNDVDDRGFTNAVYVTPDHRFGTVGGIAMDNEHASAAIYNFRLLVSDGSITRTGLFNVASALQTPGHPNIPVGVTAFFKGATNSLNWSLISQPAGSTATLTHTNGLIAALRPDVEGAYIIRDNVTGQTLTNTAASYTGYQFCAICHGPNNNVGQADLVTPWQGTLHSSMAQRGIDGAFGSHYSEACLQCHTVGFNQSPAATNGNFFAVQQEVGWKFPTVLKAGNYAAMPDQLKAVANIQCESCHGAGSRHPGSPSVSLDEKVCSNCHEDGSHHVHPEQWEISPHAGAYEAISQGEGLRSPCSRCHSPAGFIDEAKRLNAGVPISVINSNTVLGVNALTCQACHDPHDTFGDPARHQLRVYDTVTVGDPSFTKTITTDIVNAQALLTGNLAVSNSNVTVTNTAKIASCIICHNARREANNLNGTSGKKYYQNSSPHDSPIAESFLGIGCVDYGVQMGNSFHTYLAECTTCHMYALRAPSGSTALDSLNIGGVVTPVNAATYAKYSNVLGAHTFSMTYLDGTNEVQNIAACNQCHSSFETVDSFDFLTAFGKDYDGDGSIDGIQTEVGTGLLTDINPNHGLMNMLLAKMQQSGMTMTTNRGYVNGFGNYSTNAVISEAQHKAAWNFLVLRRDGSRGVHNTQFTVRLLQTTYTDLSTAMGGGTFQAEHPKAFLR